MIEEVEDDGSDARDEAGKEESGATIVVGAGGWRDDSATTGKVTQVGDAFRQQLSMASTVTATGGG